MPKWIDEIKYDLNFLKSHTLQPQWFKIVKVFILLFLLAGYYFPFGLLNTILFFVTFIFLMSIIHFTYRSKTKKYTKNWLDFVVNKNDENLEPKRIGKYYYPVIIVNAVISFIISQLLPSSK
ncbi:MAG: hypothetical protein HN390_16035 [Anaerolineae bacterium]|jgi:hypothetical protein|nr:hypothetical protein [Anaerolineae bacterium]MBT7602507.1 hypothetical protein [Anaerolineae bacterium]